MCKDYELERLQSRIADLEEKVEHLRFSRRVLMSLIERIEQERLGCVSKLEQENKKLQSCNSRYAKRLVNKNRQIVLLQAQLSRNESDSAEDRAQL